MNTHSEIGIFPLSLANISKFRQCRNAPSACPILQRHRGPQRRGAIIGRAPDDRRFRGGREPAGRERGQIAGVDILVVSGTEAGGHCGGVSTLVLVAAIRPISDVPIMAAGGIVTGRQMAACMAMGADGAWTGSVWLTTAEAETSSVAKEKMLAVASVAFILDRCLGE
jgi:hypothetical protein